MKNTLTRAELCRALDVSRYWVNTHLQHLGKVEMMGSNDTLNKRAATYEAGEVLDWFNENAEFSRQTHWLNLLDYAAEQEIESVYNEMGKCPSTIDGVKKRVEILRDFLRQILPAETFAAFTEYDTISVRQRDSLPWVETDAKITDLEQLYTIKKLRRGKNSKIAYRDIFNRGMIRVKIHGREWFMNDEQGSLQYKMLMSAGVK